MKPKFKYLAKTALAVALAPALLTVMGLLAIEYIGLYNSWTYILAITCALCAVIIKKSILSNLSIHICVLLGTWPLLFVLLSHVFSQNEYTLNKLYSFSFSALLAYGFIVIRGKLLIIASVLSILVLSITEAINDRKALDNSLSLQKPTKEIKFSDFTFYMRDSTRFDLAGSVKAKITCVTFSTTGCAPCLRLKPLWRELELKNKTDREVQFLNVFADGSKDAWREFKEIARSLPEDMTVVYDDSVRLARALGVQLFPSTFIFDAQGNQVLRYDGFTQSNALFFKGLFQSRLDSVRAREAMNRPVSAR